MFLSIIIPVYNAEKYLAECLDSCLDQDIPQDDYEIICVNDGSRDGSAAILDAYAAAHSNIRVLHKENAGVSEARNDGLHLANGEYLWFVDNDDLIHPGILSTLRRRVEARPCVKLVFPYYEFTDTLSREELSALQNGTLAPSFALCSSVVWAYLIRKDFLESHHILHRGRREDSALMYGYGVDNLFVYECSKYLPETETFNDVPVYLYRRNASSVTKDLTPQAQMGRISEYAKLAAFMLDEYRALPEEAAVKSAAADLLMLYLRRSTTLTAQLPSEAFHRAVCLLKQLKLFPFHQPAECTYSCKAFASEQNGMGKLQNIFRFYSITRPGLFCLASCYRLRCLKVRISRALRSNPAMRALLDLKNRLLGR